MDNKMPWEVNVSDNTSYSMGNDSPKPWEQNYANQSGSSQNDEGRSWGIYNNDDGSILDTAWKGVKRLGENTLAAIADDPEASRYQIKRAEKASRDYMEANDKLGYAGQFVSGAAQYAPVIAASAANPALGAGLFGLQSTGETLAAQHENGQDYNLGTAAAVGVGSAGLNAVTGGMGGRVANAAWSSPVKQNFLSQAAKRAVGAVAPDAIANAGQQAMTNLASNQDIGHGVAEAAAVGGIAGGSFRGAKKGFDALHGWNAETGTKVNDSGQASINRQHELENSGFKMPEKLGRSAIEFDNKATDLNKQIANTPVGADSNKAIQELIDVSMTHGSPSALGFAAKAMVDSKMPASIKAFDIQTGTGYDHGGNVENLGLMQGHSPIQMDEAGRRIYRLDSDKKAHVESGMTTEQQLKKIETSYEVGLTNLNKPIREGMAALNNLKSQLEITGEKNPDLDIAIKYMKELTDYSANSTGKSSHRPSAAELKTTSYGLMRALHDSGMIGEFAGLDGKKGSFNPIQTIDSIQKFHDMTVAQHPTVRNSNTNASKSTAKKGGSWLGDLATDGFLMAHGLPPIKSGSKLVVGGAKLLKGFGKDKKNIKEFEDGVAEANAITEGYASHINKAAEAGDFAGGAVEAAGDLQAMGINPGVAHETTPPVVESAPVEPVEAPVSRSNPEMADGMARRPELREEPVEAPVEDASMGNPDEVAAMARQPERKVMEEPVQEVAPEENVTVVEPETPTPRGNPDEVAALSSKPKKKAEPVVEEEVEVTEPAVKAREVLRPLQKRIREIETTPRKEVSKMEPVAKTRLANELRQKKDLIRDINSEVNQYSRNNKDFNEIDVWNAVEEMGGVDKITANGRSPKEGLNSLMREYRNNKSIEAEANAKLARERAKAADDAANEKLDEIVGKNKEEIRENTRKTLKSKGLSDEVIEKAFKMAKEEIGDDFAPSHVGNYAKRVAKEEAEKATAEAASAEQAKGKIRGEPEKTIQDTINDLNHYADTLGASKNEAVMKIIADTTRTPRGKGKALGESQVRSALNKMHKVLEEQADDLVAARKASKDSKERAKFENQINVLKHRLNKAEELKTTLMDRIQKANESSKKVAERKANAIEKADAAQKQAKEANERLKKVEDATSELNDKIELNQEQIRKEIKDALHQKFADLKPDEVEHLVRAIADKVPEGLDGIHDRDFIKFDAMLDASEDAMVQLGKKDYASAIKHTKGVIEKAMKRKEITDDPDLWFSTTDKHLLNEHMSDNGPLNTFYGLMYEKARVAIFGDSQSHKRVRYPEKMINRKLKEIQKASEGVGEGGIDAVGIK